LPGKRTPLGRGHAACSHRLGCRSVRVPLRASPVHAVDDASRAESEGGDLGPRLRTAVDHPAAGHVCPDRATDPAADPRRGAARSVLPGREARGHLRARHRRLRRHGACRRCPRLRVLRACGCRDPKRAGDGCDDGPCAGGVAAHRPGRPEDPAAAARLGRAAKARVRPHVPGIRRTWAARIEHGRRAVARPQADSFRRRRRSRCPRRTDRERQMTKKILVTGGLGLVGDPRRRNPPRGDLAAAHGRISQLTPHGVLSADAHAGNGAGGAAAGAEVIDATDHWVIPGFVDTHTTLWQSTMRALTGDWLLDDYFWCIRMNHMLAYTAADVYASTCGGGVAQLGAGVTTTVDFSHCVTTLEHADAGVEAIIGAGGRAVWCYGFWSPSPQTPAFASVEERFRDARRIASTYFPSP